MGLWCSYNLTKFGRIFHTNYQRFYVETCLHLSYKHHYTVLIVIKTFLIPINKLSLPNACYNVFLVCFAFLPENSAWCQAEFGRSWPRPSTVWSIVPLWNSCNICFSKFYQFIIILSLFGSEVLIGGEKVSRYLLLFFPMLLTSWSYCHGDWRLPLNYS